MAFNSLLRQKRLLCIDIGCKKIKVAEMINSKANNLTIQRFGMTDSPKGCIENGSISNLEDTVSTISNILSSKKIKAKSSKIIVSGTNAITRVCTIKSVYGEDLNTTVMNRVVPNIIYGPIKDYQVSYKLIGTHKDINSEKFTMLLTVVPNAVLQSYLDVLTGLDLEPLALGLSSNSIEKFFNRFISADIFPTNALGVSFPEDGDSNYAVIDFGFESTSVNIFHNRVLGLNRVIPYGANNIDSQISEDLSITAQVAEGFKIKYGIVTPNTSSANEHYKTYESIKKSVQTLINQIKLCLDFFTRTFGINLKNIIIMGGGAQLAGLREYLELTLDAYVCSVDRLKLNGIKLEDDISSEQLNYLINCIGICM